MRSSPRLFALAILAPLAALAACAAPQPEEMCTSSTSAALRVCAMGATVQGVDVSTYQGTVNWASVKAAGNVFGFARVSDGLTHADDTFATNWAQMKANGIVRGAYQYFRASEDPIKQADMVLAAIGQLGAGDLPPVMDIEVSDGQSPATIQSQMNAWLSHIEQKIGKKPIIYTAANMTSNIGDGFVEYPLWVANYGASCPSMPSSWTAWKFWQTSESGTVAGISGATDLDEFQGTLSDLLAFADGAPTPSDAGAGGPSRGDAGGPSGGDAGAALGSGAGSADASAKTPLSTEAGVTDPCTR